MRIVDLDQGSPDWLLWRRAGLGSSDAAVLVLGECWGKTPDDLLGEKAGLVRREGKQSSAMSFGKEMEPYIRTWYEGLVGFEASPLCCVHDQHDWLKASLDGWNNGVILEMKCANRADHQSALDGLIPDKYVPQVEHQLLVTWPLGRLVHYVSYNRGKAFSEAERYALVPFLPDPARLAALLEVERAFWGRIEECCSRR